MSERDKFLTEAMGECWHREDQMTNHGKVGTGGCLSTRYVCGCGRVFNQPYNGGDINPVDFIRSFWRSGINFSTWQGLGKLIEFMDAEYSDEFIANALYTVAIDGCVQNIPDKLANHIYDGMKERN